MTNSIPSLLDHYHYILFLCPMENKIQEIDAVDTLNECIKFNSR